MWVPTKNMAAGLLCSNSACWYVFAAASSFDANCSSMPSGSSAETTVSQQAQKIHDSALIIDTHADTPQRFLDEGFDIGSTDPNDIGQKLANKKHV